VDTNTNGLLDLGDTDIMKYEWDHRNRLRAVINYASYADYGSDVSSQRVDYGYDYAQRLVSRTVDTDGSGATAAETDYWAYDGNQMLVKFHEAGGSENLVSRYLWGPLVDQLIAEERYTDDAAHDDPAVEEGFVFWALTDHQGTTRELIQYDDVSGATTVAAHFTYTAFGELTGSTGSITTDLRYTGRFFDIYTDQQWNLNRWYDPKTQRWISEDPIGFAGGDKNLTRSLANDPVNRIDPDGHIVIWVHGAMNNNSNAVENGILPGLEAGWNKLAVEPQKVVLFQYKRKILGGSLSNKGIEDREVAELWPGPTTDAVSDVDSKLNQFAGRALAALIEHYNEERERLDSCEPINVIGYSNGSVPAYLAIVREGAKADSVLLLGGVLDPETDWGRLPNIRDTVYNYVSDGDKMLGSYRVDRKVNATALDAIKLFEVQIPKVDHNTEVAGWGVSHTSETRVRGRSAWVTHYMAASFYANSLTNSGDRKLSTHGAVDFHDGPSAKKFEELQPRYYYQQN
jgi:RHS repeat-associated protein